MTRDEAARRYATETQHMAVDPENTDAEVLVHNLRCMAFATGYDAGMVAAGDRERKAFEWIPISERLPEKSGFYLAMLEGFDEAHEAHYDADPIDPADLKFFDEGDFARWEMGEETCVVTHWMPLPAPPNHAAKTQGGPCT